MLGCAKLRSVPDTGNRFVWVDLETTGLDPEQGKILEIATIITDDTTLEELWVDHQVVGYDYLDMKSMSPEVVAMHNDSGLFLALLAEDLMPWYGVAERLTRHLMNAGGAEKPLLAGNTVSFDRRWLAKHAPAAEACLHYRNLDVSSIYEMLLRSKWRDRVIEIKESTPKAHRALEDVRHSIHMYRLFRDLCGLDEVPSFDDMRSY